MQCAVQSQGLVLRYYRRSACWGCLTVVYLVHLTLVIVDVGEVDVLIHVLMNTFLPLPLARL